MLRAKVILTVGAQSAGWLANATIFKHALRTFSEDAVEVKAVIAIESLLVFPVSQGWESLCDFLGILVPAEPFPRGIRRGHVREVGTVSGGAAVVSVKQGGVIRRGTNRCHVHLGSPLFFFLSPRERMTRQVARVAKGSGL
ncbi:sulfotransferase [Nonomuraea sp. NPDC026600]|uniref:sulfotransferase n=1 Tax=Nonomuraea sp. NPDC026600 TaxID=3155363 RepID=UPI0033D04267